MLSAAARAAALLQPLVHPVSTARHIWVQDRLWHHAATQPGPSTCRRSTSPRSLTAAAASAAAAAGAMELAPRAKAVLDYWFGDGWEAAVPGDSRPQRMKIWFMGGPEVDAEIISQFSSDCQALARGELDAWQQQPLEALAGIIIGDQLYRNAYRGTAQMYAADPTALAWAKQLMASGADRQLAPIQRVFVYMPLMHSEALEDQDECVARFEGLAQECEAGGFQEMAKMAQGNVKYADSHREVVKRWGRFPHRNAILARPSTPEEAAGIAAGTIPKW